MCICMWSFRASRGSGRAVKPGVFQGMGQLIAFPDRSECRAGLRRAAPEERWMQGVQGCKYRAGAVRKDRCSLPVSSVEEKGFLEF